MVVNIPYMEHMGMVSSSFDSLNFTSEHLCGRQVQSSSVDSFSEHLAKVQSQSRQHIAELILGANGELRMFKQQKWGLNKNDGDFYRFLLVSIVFKPKTWPLAYKRNNMINDARINGIND
jgi:hypothetical protein